MSDNTTTVVSKAMEFTLTEIQEMRMEIITMFDGRPTEQSQIYPGIYVFRDNMVVRCGRYRDEFENQLHVWKLADPSIVRVPQPIDIFHYKYPGHQRSTVFLVMEYAANAERQLEGGISDAQINQVATIIDYLMTFKGTVPGGLNKGAWNRGLMFGDFAFAPKPGSMKALNKWINRRSAPRPFGKPQPCVDVGEFDLVLCHMDIDCKDILWPSDEEAPWLLDWKRAVYLPRLFQHWIHMHIRGDRDFHNRILSKLEPLTEQETKLQGVFGTAYGNAIRSDT